MAKTSPGQFVRQVRQEVSKVSWPSQREATVTSIMVFIMVLVMSLFFLAADKILSSGVQFVLGLGG
ncbi:MAG: preprotein translocase subunit SecE [Sphingomonadales bacterium]|nr:preprotein translocase subunit SecE [Sphingomonadales bacterium]